MKLILLRHGQSVWNLENRFTGWTDVGLSETGVQEALQAGKDLKATNLTVDVVFTSVLKRAIETFELANKTLNLNVPVYRSWKLNERHYGALQGLNKAETAQKYGDEQVKLWRRSAGTRPPLLNADDSRNPAFSPLYEGVDKTKLPLGESLNDTVVRVKECYESEIAPLLQQNKNVLISAHGNSLRALVKILENVSDEGIMQIEIPTGKPIIYTLNAQLQITNKECL